ncbi:hypothetical protein [Sinomonas sp. ASV322]|uniref:hypothetical protein n=1 Tax=Sinomonas sp. ASV322 TaxID=3041920 RepID=UPI0027DB93E0|nr:hypothetical protein [Sinomonas sp. ASV322]MDQ4502373.1 hypothetical protein [Sinomonas sp. ASV322]
MNQLMVPRIQPANPFHQLMKALQPHLAALTMAFHTHGAADLIQLSTGPMLIRFWCSNIDGPDVPVPAMANGEGIEASAAFAANDVAATDLDAAVMSLEAEAERTAAGAESSTAVASARATDLLCAVFTAVIESELMVIPHRCLSSIRAGIKLAAFSGTQCCSPRIPYRLVWASPW